MSILVGLLAFALLVVLNIVLKAYAEFAIYSFYLLWILPVGAVAIGLVGGFGHSFGLLWSHRRPSLGQRLMTGVLALAAWISIYVGVYGLTYATEDAAGAIKINYAFQGEHISHYQTSRGEPVDFWVHLKQTVATRRYTSLHNYQAEPASTDEPFPVFNWIRFALEGVGFFVGAIASDLLLLGDRHYCDACERYGKRRRVMAYRVGDHQQVVRAINDALASPPAFVSLMQTHHPSRAVTGEPHIAVDITYCPDCHDGRLVLRAMTRRGQYGLEEDTASRQVVPLLSEYVLQVITSA